MPYVKQEDRDYLKKNPTPRTSGELNYMITLLLIKYFDNYDTINEMKYVVLKYIHALLSADASHLILTLPHDEFDQEIGLLLGRTMLLRSSKVGALGCAWDEFYARKARPYEKKKIKENGDVY